MTYIDLIRTMSVDINLQKFYLGPTVSQILFEGLKVD